MWICEGVLSPKASVRIAAGVPILACSSKVERPSYMRLTSERYRSCRPIPALSSTARALPLHGRGSRFESLRADHNAGLRSGHSWESHKLLPSRYVSSNLTPATKIYRRYMANHKRHRTKSQRSGCLYCKPHKIWGNSKKAIQHKYLKLMAS